MTTRTAFVNEVTGPILAPQGKKMPASAFRPNGIFPVATVQYEIGDVAVKIPQWDKENCIQCNQCTMVCPHASLRPVLVTDEELRAAPETFETKKVSDKELQDYHFRIQVNPQDCMGCGNCVDVCPAKKKALVMQPLETQLDLQLTNQQYAGQIPIRDNLIANNSVKGSQFCWPLLEFSGACAGCGETPYAKLVTQLFGDRIVIGNTSGCSSIWGGSVPSVPYCVNVDGHGPTWGNSLFEDPAEFTYGILLDHVQQRGKLVKLLEAALCNGTPEDIKEAIRGWLANRNDPKGAKEYGQKLKELLKARPANALLGEIASRSDLFNKKSYWVFCGDGEAEDIAFGGIDHILASGEDINVLVFDAKVYANTGGQTSKEIPPGHTAKFTASSKKTPKKDMGSKFMSYGHVYVASVAMGADKRQLLKALIEAESYVGPSLILAYSPCNNHGTKMGMGNSQEETLMAVTSGYWPLYRYDPVLKARGQNPFTLDSKTPDGSLREFLSSEVRCYLMQHEFPQDAELLVTQLESEYTARYQRYWKYGLKRELP